MNLFHEWPLVIFTLMVQVAVGSCLAILGVRGMLWAAGASPPDYGRLKASGEGSHEVDAAPLPEERAPGAMPWDQRPFLLVGVLTALGLGISLLHLGAPLNAIRTLSNIGHSWLSREILAGLMFLGLWAVNFHLDRRPPATPWLRGAFLPALALAGVLLIWSMARVYMLPARPLWDSWLTLTSFFLTTILLGAVAMAAYLERVLPLRFGFPDLSPATRSRLLPRPRPALLAVGLAAVVAQLGVTLSHPVTAELRSSGAGTALTNARGLLLLAGACLVIAALARPALANDARSETRKPWPWATIALLLFLASEAVGRMLFYAVGATDSF